MWSWTHGNMNYNDNIMVCAFCIESHQDAAERNEIRPDSGTPALHTASGSVSAKLQVRIHQPQIMCYELCGVMDYSDAFATCDDPRDLAVELHLGLQKVSAPFSRSCATSSQYGVSSLLTRGTVNWLFWPDMEPGICTCTSPLLCTTIRPVVLKYVMQISVCVGTLFEPSDGVEWWSRVLID
ncbi:hypothetical protein J1614_010382 [Plenodomus biglobosus]|nr:hypothetical protein J1614_010382 [Plenodomus biglobosus]